MLKSSTNESHHAQKEITQMKPKQIVGVVLGIILLLLALMAFLMGGPTTEGQTGQISLLFAVVLGVIIIVSNLKEPKAKQAPGAQQEQPLPPPPSDEELPPPPPGYEPPTSPQPQQAIHPPTAAKAKKTPQVVAVVIVVIVAVALILVMFGGTLLGLGGPFSGTWKGTGDYYYVDIFGQRDSYIHGSVVMKLTQTGSTVKGTLNIEVLTQVDVGDPGYVPAVDEHKSVRGTVNGTTVVFMIKGLGVGGTEYTERWDFTKVGNELVGKVTNLDTYAYLGLDSDAGAFHLSK